MINNYVLDEVFGALAGQSRRDIIAHLQSGPHTMSELARPLDMSLSALNKHIRVMERAGLVSRHRAGRQQLVHLESATLQDALTWFDYQRQYWAQQLGQN